jgi:hypothetical protein
MENTDEEKEVCSFLEKKLALFNQYLSITKRLKETLRDKEASSLGVFILTWKTWSSGPGQR